MIRNYVICIKPRSISEYVVHAVVKNVLPFTFCLNYTVTGEPDALKNNVEKQSSIIPFSFLLGVWVRSKMYHYWKSYKQSLTIKQF